MSKKKQQKNVVKQLEQQVIHSFMETLQMAINARAYEVGGREPDEFVRHDGYTYSFRLRTGRSIVMKLSLKETSAK